MESATGGEDRQREAMESATGGEDRQREAMESAWREEDMEKSRRKVAVVGAGVSGLAAAYKLKSHGLDVTVFEAEGRAGGKLRSLKQNGLIWDEGANTMTEAQVEVKNMLDVLGLREKQQFPISQNKRYIVRNGEPVMIPTNPIAFLKSNILSAQSKLQVLMEPLFWKKKDSSQVSDMSCQESVGGFFGRHFGSEAVEYLIDPFVAGTSAADPESLSMLYSFPELWNLEKRFGSVIVGAIKSKLSAKGGESREAKESSQKRKTQRGSFSFQGGMQTLTDSLCKVLSTEELKLDSKVLSLAYSQDTDSQSKNWSLSCASANEDNSPSYPFDAVIMTAPLCNVKEMEITREGNCFPLDFLPEVNYMPLSVIITTFGKKNVKRPLEGFGVLVPSKEQENGLKTLGTLFSSTMFPDRAPGDSYLYTTFVGGSRNPLLAKASTDELKQIVCSDLHRLLGAEGEPMFLNHYYWSKAFPLYGRNYSSVLEAIDKMEKDLPGFFYAGNHRGGISVGKSIASGCQAADLVVSYLEACSEAKMLDDASSPKQ